MSLLELVLDANISLQLDEARKTCNNAYDSAKRPCRCVISRRLNDGYVEEVQGTIELLQQVAGLVRGTDSRNNKAQLLIKSPSRRLVPLDPLTSL